MDSDFACMKVSSTGSTLLFTCITTLNLVAQDYFVPLEMLKTMISSRWEAVGKKNLGKVDKELDNINFSGVHPIMVLHVHGGPAMSRNERLWFKENLGGFVWD